MDGAPRLPAPPAQTLGCLRWEVAIADALRARGLAPLAAKTVRIDALVFARLARWERVPAIWPPDRAVRAERQRACFRLHLVRHRTALKNRIRAILIAFDHPVPVSDPLDMRGRDLLASLAPEHPIQPGLSHRGGGEVRSTASPGALTTRQHQGLTAGSYS